MKQLGLFGDDKPVKAPKPTPPTAQLKMFTESDVVQFGVTTDRPKAENRSYSMPGGLWPIPTPEDTEPAPATQKELGV